MKRKAQEDTDKKGFIRIRSDKELKDALKNAAAQDDRQEADQARHLLRVALGLSPAKTVCGETLEELKKRVADLEAQLPH